MHIMCVCLFSTLSRRLGALQISIIIIIIKSGFSGRTVLTMNPKDNPRYREVK